MDLSYISVISQLLVISRGVGARGRGYASPVQVDEEQCHSKQLAAWHCGGINRAAPSDTPVWYTFW